MENPIKHKQCGHRMSAAGFQVLKEGAGTCFQPGCSSRWVPTGRGGAKMYEDDTEFETKMRRFFRLQSTQTNTQTQQPIFNVDDPNQSINMNIKAEGNNNNNNNTAAYTQL